MNIIEAIKQRRTVKPENFTRKKIDDSLIWKMLEAANFAPTHALTQPWRFKVFSGEGLKNFGHFHAELYQKSVATEQFLKAKYLSLIHI